MAENLSPKTLGKMMDTEQNSSPVIIIIDCRAVLALTSGIIRGANEVHCPPIVKRRSGGNIPLANILRNVQTRELFMKNKFSCIVVYDEKTSCLDDLAQDSNMYLVIKTLSESIKAEKIFYLNGK